MNSHLNQEAMLRWQAGEASEVEQAHVAECAECRAQTQPLADALQWFGSAARQWGAEKAALAQEWREARAAAMQEWHESKSAAARSWRSMAAAWVTVGVALLLMFGIGLPRWEAHRAAIEAQVQQRQQQQAQQELVRDNALLEEVDQDVSQEVPSAMQPLSWSASDTTTRQ
jgi:hypothetical protein